MPQVHSGTMTNERRESDLNSPDRPAQPAIGEGAAEEATFSEGIGGVPDVDEEQRATVGDVDGDNVADGEELRR